jgi:hypothetical protein
MSRHWNLPTNWPQYVRSAVLDVAAMAHTAVCHTRAWTADSRLRRVQLAARLEQSDQELMRVLEELQIKDARMARLPAHRRPFYSPTERLRILQIKAVRGWTLAQTAQAFGVEPATIASWSARCDESTDGLQP